MKKFFKKIKKYPARFYSIRYILTFFMILYLRFVYYTNPFIEDSDDPRDAHKKYNPFIITFWHGRHIMGPFLRPYEEKIVAMFSRSDDAVLNASIGERLGLEVVRGSGGRQGKYHLQKKGSEALLLLRRALKNGKNTAIIADISHQKSREAGRGIILLAKISGRPIVPYVYTFSREKILKNTWDKTAIPLPFGRSIFLMGDAFYVPKDANSSILEKRRIELTDIMNNLTDKAFYLLKKSMEY